MAVNVHSLALSPKLQPETPGQVRNPRTPRLRAEHRLLWCSKLLTALTQLTAAAMLPGSLVPN